MKKGVVLLPILMFLPLIASAFRIGVASYYAQPYIPSACFQFEEKGVYLAAVNNELWQNRKACGQLYDVYCVGARNIGVLLPCNSKQDGKPIGVTVRVVDYCNNCNGSTMLLSEQAFTEIANIQAGSILVSYEESS